MEKLTKVTLHLIGLAQSKGPEVFLADSTLYLEFFGIISIAWQWLLQAPTSKRPWARTRRAPMRTSTRERCTPSATSSGMSCQDEGLAKN